MQCFDRSKGQPSMKQLSFIFFLSLVLGSCSYPCGKSEGLRLHFVSYSKQEIYNFSISRYKKGSNFNNHISTVSFDSAQLGINQRGDTIGFYLIGSDLLLPSEFDYKIQLPTSSSTYLLSDLHEPQQTGVKNGQKVYCMNQIVSCKVNGTAVTISYEDLFLKK